MTRLVFVPVLFLTACGGPSDNDVRNTFLAGAPQAQIQDLGPGEGDGGNVYYHIKYRIPPDTILWEQVWLYQKGSDGKWSITWRDTIIAKRAT
jgi:hypothetical protein